MEPQRKLHLNIYGMSFGTWQMDNCSHQYGGEVLPQGREGQFNRLIHWPFTFWFQLGTCQQRNIFYLTQSPGQHRCSIRQPVLPNYGDHRLGSGQDDSTQLFLVTLNTWKTPDLCKEGPQEEPYVTASHQSSWPKWRDGWIVHLSADIWKATLDIYSPMTLINSQI